MLTTHSARRTNNWADYGGMDVYTKQILGSSNDHDAFYTNDNIKVSIRFLFHVV